MRRPTLTLVYASVFGFAGWALGLARLHDNSFFWHLRTGELILEEGIPRTDPYSWASEGTTWIAQSWLAELAYGVLDRTFGPFAIRLFSAFVAAFIMVSVFLLANRLAGHRLRAAGLALVVFSCVYFMFSARPLLLGLALLLVLVWIVEVPDSWVGHHPTVAIPMVIWIWANVHGTWSLGLLYLGLHLAGRWLEGARPWERPERRILIGAVVGGLLTFVNPYGWRLVFFPVQLLGRGEHLRMLREWQSPDFSEAHAIAFAAWLAVFVVVVAVRRISTRDLVVAVPFFMLALWSLRNIAVAVLVTLPIVARALAAPATTPTRNGVETSGDSEGFSGAGWALLATVLVLTVAVTVAAAGQEDFDFGADPVAAITAAEEEGLGGRRWLTTEAAAGYVILTRWPAQQIFVDDRVDMTPTEVRDAYVTVAGGGAGWDESLQEYGVEVVIWPVNSPLGQLLEESAAWERVAEGGSGVWVPSP